MRISLVGKASLLLVVALLTPALGCRPGSSDGVTDSAFVAVMAQLKRVHDAPGMDSAQRAAQRTSILQKGGLTPEKLDSTARRLAQNPARAQTVWQAIERLAADTTKAK